MTNKTEKRLLFVPIKNDIKESIEYMAVPQTDHSNKLVSVLHSNKLVDDKASELTDTKQLMYKDGTITLKVLNQKNIGVSATKAFHILLYLTDQQNSNRVSIKLTEYMNIRGLKSRPSARRQVLKDMETLHATLYTFERGDKTYKLSPSAGFFGIENGTIFFTFSEEYLCTFRNSFLYLDNRAFKYNDKENPHSFYFHWCITLNYRMNCDKPNHNIVSVRKLIETAPSFPKYNKVRGEFNRMVVEPFERDMDNLEGIKWEYVGEAPYTYEEFINANVRITMLDKPNLDNLMDLRKKGRKKITALKEKAVQEKKANC